MERATLTELVRQSRAVARHAFAPASGFAVGAALLADDGRIFTGCNVENASYGLTICAERNAVFHAVAEGARRFVAIAVHTPLRVPATPCGACRQVLIQFGTKMDVILVGSGQKLVRTRLAALLPTPFTFDASRAPGRRVRRPPPPRTERGTAR